ncbi:MAG: hypothetical protein SOX82_09305, partial [Eubacteriales bacterium]|nr:hypothetical protein [Eubacteriales bacterium]
MQFYKFEGITTDEKWSEGNDNRRVMYEKTEKISIKTGSFNQLEKRKAYLFVNDASGNLVTGGIIMNTHADVFNLVSGYLQTIELELKDIRLEEITFSTLRNMLAGACRKDYINDDDEVLEQFDLDKLNGRYGRGISFGEHLLEDINKKAVYKDAARFLAKDALISELDRIYAGSSKQNVVGHPVHYLIQTDDRETRKGMFRIILQALYANNRLHNKRYCFLNFRPGENFSSMVYDCLYKSAVGGAIVVRYLANDDTEDDHASCGRETIETLCEIMKKYRNQVLTVFCLPRECTASKDIFYENLGNTSIVEFKEEFVSGECAKGFLKTLAKDSRIRTDKKL